MGAALLISEMYGTQILWQGRSKMCRTNGQTDSHTDFYHIDFSKDLRYWKMNMNLYLLLSRLTFCVSAKVLIFCFSAKVKVTTTMRTIVSLNILTRLIQIFYRWLFKVMHIARVKVLLSNASYPVDMASPEQRPFGDFWNATNRNCHNVRGTYLVRALHISENAMLRLTCQIWKGLKGESHRSLDSLWRHLQQHVEVTYTLWIHVRTYFGTWRRLR